MFEKQAYEAAKLENDLKRTELDSINDTLDECEKKKQRSIEEAKADRSALNRQEVLDLELHRCASCVDLSFSVFAVLEVSALKCPADSAYFFQKIRSTSACC
jgi:hypothetical protein